MEQQKKKNWRFLRIVGVLLLGLLILAGLLPNSGGMISGPPPNPSMWRFGPFLFFPDVFFYIGVVVLLTACTVFGILKRNKCEVVGWILLGLMLGLTIIG